MWSEVIIRFRVVVENQKTFIWADHRAGYKPTTKSSSVAMVHMLVNGLISGVEQFNVFIIVDKS